MGEFGKSMLSTLVVGALAGLTCYGLQHGSGTINADSGQPATEIAVIAPTPSAYQGRAITATITAYCPCAKCCGKDADGVTSRGKNAFTTRGVAVDPKVIHYGSMVTIPGFGTFEADDTGGAMRQATKRGEVHIDLRFPTHQEALNFGRRKMTIYVKER